jgi:hypothetical protein
LGTSRVLADPLRFCVEIRAAGRAEVQTAFESVVFFDGRGP